MASSKQSIAQLYRLILNRPLDDSEMRYWENAAIGDAVVTLMNSQELLNRLEAIGQCFALERLELAIANDWELVELRMTDHTRHALEAQEVPLVAYSGRAEYLDVFLATMHTNQFIAPSNEQLDIFSEVLRRCVTLSDDDFKVVTTLINDQYYLSRIFALIFSLAPIYDSATTPECSLGWLSHLAEAGNHLQIYCLHEQSIQLHRRVVFDRLCDGNRKLNMFNLS